MRDRSNPIARPIDPRTTNVAATVAIAVLGAVALVAAAIGIATDAEPELVIAALGVGTTALAGLAPSPVQRPGA